MADTQYLTVDHLDTRTITRIFSKIQIDHETGCWNWTGALNTYGYGQVWFENRDALTHRVLYAWLVEPLPRGHGRHIPQIDHLACENRRCCNPSHLELVSARQNQLRGNGVGGVSSRKTHCKNGHPLPTVPNRITPHGVGRKCITCRRVHGYEAYLRRTAHHA